MVGFVDGCYKMGFEKKPGEKWRGKRLEGWHRKEVNFLN
jgi:hypothetical protein